MPDRLILAFTLSCQFNLNTCVIPSKTGFYSCYALFNTQLNATKGAIKIMQQCFTMPKPERVFLETA